MHDVIVTQTKKRTVGFIFFIIFDTMFSSLPKYFLVILHNVMSQKRGKITCVKWLKKTPIIYSISSHTIENKRFVTFFIVQEKIEIGCRLEDAQTLDPTYNKLYTIILQLLVMEVVLL